MRCLSPTRCLTEASPGCLAESKFCQILGTRSTEAANDHVLETPYEPDREVFSPSPIAPGALYRGKTAPDIIQRFANLPSLNIDLSFEGPYPCVFEDTDSVSEAANVMTGCGSKQPDTSDALFAFQQTRNTVPSQVVSPTESRLDYTPSHPTTFGEYQDDQGDDFAEPSEANGGIVSAWLTGLITPSYKPEMQKAPTLPALQRLKTGKEYVEPGNLGVVEYLTAVASQRSLPEGESSIEPPRGKPIVLSDDISSSGSEKTSPSTDSPLSPVRANLDDIYHNFSPEYFQMRFESRYDGPPSPTRDQELATLDPMLSPKVVPNEFLPKKPRDSTLGTINWEKSWYKHKPRRAHDVSEVTSPDYSVHAHAVDLFSMAGFNSDNSGDDNPAENTAKLDAVNLPNALAFKSCPELGSAGDVEVNKSTSKMSQIRHRNRYGIRKAFRYVKRKFSGASTNVSIRSDFPDFPRGAARRILSRDSTDIYQSSEEETQVFNTPVRTPLEPLSPLKEDLEGVNDTYNDAPTIFRASVLDEDDDMFRPSVSPSVLLNKSTARSTPARLGPRRRTTTKSRLSEVTTPEDLATSDPFPSPYSLEVDHDSADCAVVDSLTDEEAHLSPRWQTTGHYGSNPGLLSTPSSAQHYRSSPILLGEAHFPQRPGLELRRAIETMLEDASDTHPESNTAERTLGADTSGTEFYRSLDSQAVDTLESRDRQAGADSRPSSPPLLSLGPALIQQHPARTGTGPSSDADTSDTAAAKRESCHPDTWNSLRGEPGDSDPFCPPTCNSDKPSPRSSL
ncbi:hypothetical protein G7054_g1150 [Neopestalotiopsis clavispora]|nr:hypothetical protein G7054_g1150 [Neopestalotiopsis clavispora]